MLQGSEQLFINRVDGITAIVFAELLASAYTTSPSPTNPLMEDDTPTVMIVIILLAVAIMVIIIAVIVGVGIRYASLYATLTFNICFFVMVNACMYVYMCARRYFHAFWYMCMHIIVLRNN